MRGVPVRIVPPPAVTYSYDYNANCMCWTVACLPRYVAALARLKRLIPPVLISFCAPPRTSAASASLPPHLPPASRAPPPAPGPRVAACAAPKPSAMRPALASALSRSRRVVAEAPALRAVSDASTSSSAASSFAITCKAWPSYNHHSHDHHRSCGHHQPLCGEHASVLYRRPSFATRRGRHLPRPVAAIKRPRGLASWMTASAWPTSVKVSRPRRSASHRYKLVARCVASRELMVCETSREEHARQCAQAPV